MFLESGFYSGAPLFFHLRGRLKILSAFTCKPKDLNPWMYTCLCEKEKNKIQGQGPSEVDGPYKTLGFYPYQLFG